MPLRFSAFADHWLPYRRNSQSPLAACSTDYLRCRASSPVGGGLKVQYCFFCQRFIMPSFINWCSENGSLIVSICALGLTIQQIKATHKHNRLSVKPLLATTLVKDNFSTNQDEWVVTASIRNCGLGPAIIKDFKVLLDGYSIRASTPDELGSSVKRALAADISGSYFGVLRHGHVLNVGESFDLAKIVVRSPTPKQQQVFEQFHVCVTYESAYGDELTYDSRMHTS